MKYVIPLCPKCKHEKHYVFIYGHDTIAECEKCKWRYKGIMIDEHIFPDYVLPKASGNFSTSFMSFTDYFLETVYVSPFAPKIVVVNVSYKELAKMYHPDVCNLPDAHERFVLINQYKDNQEKLNEISKMWGL